MLELEVLADGTVGLIRVLEEPGYPRLVAAAIDAARRMRFEPAKSDGRPVRSVVRLPVRFVLK